MSLTTTSITKGHSQSLMPAMERRCSVFDKLSHFLKDNHEAKFDP